MKRLLAVGIVALIPSEAFAQRSESRSISSAQPRDAASVDASLATPTGHDVDVSVGSYTYSEPGAQRISIQGIKIGGGYTGTVSLDRRRHWFAQADVRSTIGNVTYDGWCSPWLIVPDSGSPNGYALDLGDASPCSETGDKDWYLEGRGLVGKDFIGDKWGFAPFTGLGLRHLSNGTNGTGGYRTDDYLYAPFGLTTRTNVASGHALSLTLEYDRLLHGWQKTRDSKLGGGIVPATTTAPEFTIDGFSDISFAQHSGWAVRASGKYQVTRSWSVEPYYIRWSVSDSPVNYGTATYTVNNVTAREQLGAYEPFNTTNEFGVKLGVHF
jgi:hypothetical protein